MPTCAQAEAIASQAVQSQAIRRTALELRRLSERPTELPFLSSGGAGTHLWWAVPWKKLSSCAARKRINRIRFRLLAIKPLRKEFLKSDMFWLAAVILANAAPTELEKLME